MVPGQSVDRTLAGRRGSWKNRLFPFFLSSYIFVYSHTLSITACTLVQKFQTEDYTSMSEMGLMVASLWLALSNTLYTFSLFIYKT